jgi:hypothetical protein
VQLRRRLQPSLVVDEDDEPSAVASARPAEEIRRGRMRTPASSFCQRFCAVLLDLLIDCVGVLVCGLPLALTIPQQWRQTDMEHLSVVLQAGARYWGIASLLIRCVFYTRGQTLGKAVLHMAVFDARTGRRANFCIMFLRDLLFVLTPLDLLLLPFGARSLRDTIFETRLAGLEDEFAEDAPYPPILRPASFGQQTGVLVFEAVFLFLVTVGCMVVANVQLGPPSVSLHGEKVTLGLAMFYSFTMASAIICFCMAFSTTPGKAVLGLSVFIAETRHPVGFGVMFLRELVLCPVALVDIVLVACGMRALRDTMFDTCVMHVERV